MNVITFLRKVLKNSKKKLNSLSNQAWFAFSLFFLLQILLFLPYYIFNLDNAHFFPFQEDLQTIESPWITEQHHPFRLLGEWLALVTLLFVASPLRKWINNLLKAAVYFIYPILLAYQIYLQFSYKVYGIHPSIPDDYVSVREVLPIFLRSIDLWNISVFSISFIVVALVLVIIQLMLFWFIKSLQRQFYRRSSLVILLSLWILCLLGTNQTQQFSRLDNRPYVQWVTPKIQKSLEVENIFSGKYEEIRATYGKYKDCELEQTPDIYLIFLESYGAIAYLDKDVGERVTQTAKTMEVQLDSAGWFSASGYSDAPVKGGRSWLSFTTGLIGAKIENQLSYNFLIEAPFRYPHIVDFFNQKGYFTTWISTMQMKPNIEDLIDEDELNAFWEYDNLLFYNRIPYKGPKYNDFGGLPDQYAIEFYHDQIAGSLSAPHFVFFITTSTHSPFYAPPPILEDWRAFDDLTPENPGQLTALSGKYVERYGDAMEYLIELWTRFIVEKGDQNDIFILIGDHQPPGLDWLLQGRFSTWATPLHIISKDKTLVKKFKQDGFKEGLWIDPEQGVSISHAGLYSTFMRNFLATYGHSSCPEYQQLREGIK